MLSGPPSDQDFMLKEDSPSFCMQQYPDSRREREASRPHVSLCHFQQSKQGQGQPRFKVKEK